MKKILALFMAVLLVLPLQTNVSAKTTTKSMTLYIGKKKQLTPKKKGKWKSSNKKIATVSKKGKVNPKKAGKVTVTAKIGKKNYKWKITVKKYVKVTRLRIMNVPTRKLYPGNKFKLKSAVDPSNATNKKVTWKSSNTDVATVSQSGDVVCKKEGNVTISLQSADNKKLVIKKTFTVYPAVKEEDDDKVLVDYLKIKLPVSGPFEIGEQFNLSATISPSIADNKNLRWSSNNSTVATVSNGRISCLKEGSVTITAETTDGSKLKSSVTFSVVKKSSSSQGDNQSDDLNTGNKEDQDNPSQSVIPVTSLTIAGIPGKSTLSVGDTFTLRATNIEPSNATDKDVVWKSSNTSVAKVDSSGKVTCLKKGTFYIIATFNTKTTSNTHNTRTFTVLDEVEATSLQLENIPAGNMYTGEDYTLKAVVTPENCTDKTVTWKSSDISVATVSNGTVHCVKEGTFTLTVATSNGIELKRNFTVTKKPAEVEPQITIEPSDPSSGGNQGGSGSGTGSGTGSNTGDNTGHTEIAIETINIKSIPRGELQKGSDYQLELELIPANTTETVTWKSSDEKIATVQNGKIHCLEAGDVTISFVTSGGRTWSRKFTVTDKIKAATITWSGLPKNDPAIGDQLYIDENMEVLPENTSNKTIEWTSSDPSIADITKTSSGANILSFRKKGDVTITAKTTDGSNITLSHTFHVIKKHTVVEPVITIEG